MLERVKRIKRAEPPEPKLETKPKRIRKGFHLSFLGTSIIDSDFDLGTEQLITALRDGRLDYLESPIGDRETPRL